MHRRITPLLIAALIIGFILGGIAVRAADCTAGHCDFIPVVLSSAASDTCILPSNVPTAGGDVLAWLPSYTIAPGEALAACVYTGIPSTATVYAVVHQRSGDTQTAKITADTPGGVTKIPLDTTQYVTGELVAVNVYFNDSINLYSAGQFYVLVRAAP